MTNKYLSAGSALGDDQGTTKGNLWVAPFYCEAYIMQDGKRAALRVVAEKTDKAVYIDPTDQDSIRAAFKVLFPRIAKAKLEQNIVRTNKETVIQGHKIADVVEAFMDNKGGITAAVYHKGGVAPGLPIYLIVPGVRKPGRSKLQAL